MRENHRVLHREGSDFGMSSHIAHHGFACFGLAMLLTLQGCGKLAWGEPCSKDSECDDECISTNVGIGNRAKSCTQHCDVDDDCGAGAVCFQGSFCALTCGPEDPCPGGGLCEPYFELCVAPCTADADCGNNVCVDGLCE